ncbi:MAG: hybrid sensor histidine kinase/response regulator, partial [Fibrobacterota bacterium]
LRSFSRNLPHTMSQVSTINYGNHHGYFAGIRINDDSTRNLMLCDERTENRLTILSGSTLASEIIASYPDYDPRIRPWYTFTDAPTTSAWTQIYTNMDEKMELTITHKTALRDSTGNHLGTTAVDVKLNRLRDFLRSEKISSQGIVYITDSRGRLIAHSEKGLSGMSPDTARPAAAESPLPRTRRIAAALQKREPNRIHEVTMDSQRILAIQSAFTEIPGLKWYITAAIPEEQIMGGIKQRQKTVLTAVILFILAGMGTAMILIHRLLRPIVTTAESAYQISLGKWNTPIPPSKHVIREVHTLMSAIRAMLLAITRREEKLTRARDHLETNLNELNAALEKNRALLEANPDIHLIFDRTGRIMDCHPRNNDPRHIMAPKEFLNKTVDDLFAPGPARLTRSKIHAALATGRMQFATYEMYVEGKHTYYESRYISMNGDRVLAIVRNITDARETELEKEALQGQLLQIQKMESVGRLAGGIAHDFNNMLSGVIGAAQLLKEEPGLTDEHREFIDMILTASRRGADLTHQLLTFSRKEMNTKTTVHCADLIRETVRILRRTIPREITITETINSSEDTVCAEPTLLQNVLLNLGINASHAIEKHGSITYTLHSRTLDETDCRRSPFDITPGSFAEIIVEDTGSGMPPEVQEHIFEPFYTTKEQGKGTGLGLSTAYGVIQDHNGALSVTSEVGRGTAFHILLPLHVGSEQTPTADMEPPVQGEGTVLVVDDDAIIRRVLSSQLSSLGYTVLSATDGKEGLKIFHKHRADITAVILDMMMPVMDGEETLKHLRKQAPNLPVIISSGFTGSAFVQNLKKSGAAIFLEKPFTISKLSRVLRNIL